MALSYGDPIWSDENIAPTNSLQTQIMMAGGFAGAGIGVFALGARAGNANWNPIDTIYSTSRFIAESTPFGIGNTFRIPEWLSPLTSPENLNLAQGISGLSQDNYGMSWDVDALNSTSSRTYLKKAFGLSEKQLLDAGLIPGAPTSTSTASKLVFERTANSPSGRLYTLVGGQRVDLASDVALMQARNIIPELNDDVFSLNRAFSGILRALNLWEDKDFNPNQIFSKGETLPDYLPIPSTTGQVKTFSDLNRRTAFFRGISAFEIDRFNKLISGLVDETLGHSFGGAFKELTGLGLETLPGPASHTIARIGGRVALAGGAYLALQETDWWRRRFEQTGQAAASSVVSGGLAAATYKLTKNSKASLIVGLSSFMGQAALPGFDRGIPEGIATTYTNVQLLKANAANPVNYYRRTVEGYLPGATSFEMGAFVGIAGAVGAGFLSKSLIQRFGPEKFGLAPGTAYPKKAKDYFYENLSSSNSHLNGAKYPSNFVSRMQMLGDFIWKGRNNLHGTFSTLNELRLGARKQFEADRINNPVNQKFVESLSKINSKAGGGLVGDLYKQFAGFASQMYYSAFGADVLEKSTLNQIKGLGFQSIGGKNIGILGRTNAAFTIGLGLFGLHGILSGSFLGSMKTSEQLSREYSGQDLIEVKKSRWWEAGSSPFSGTDTSYFRPHAYHLMMNRTREKGIWGSNEDSMSPLQKFFTKNFTYDLEKANYWERPYPITSAAFSDIPVIGGILGSTIGQLIKPARLMHTSEWIDSSSGTNQYMDRFQGYRKDPAYDLGAYKDGAPVSPYNATQVLLDLDHQARQLSGLTGWARSMINENITGEKGFTTGAPVMADAGMMTSYRLRFLETQQGGGLFLNEAVRRIFPSYRSEIEKQNPIQNQMPSWLPKEFHYGDPYRIVEWGEARLPGAGYASLHPELTGVDPEMYPLIHQYAILSDVAPFKEETRKVQQALFTQRSKGQTSPEMNAYMDQITKYLQRRHEGYNQKTHDPNAIRLAGSDLTSSTFGAAKQWLRKTMAPFEYLIPMGFRPVMKLLGNDRAPIEQYEHERLYGSPTAFWDKHFRDWFRPSFYSAANYLGWQGKPLWRKEADNLQKTFDQLEFIKYMKLADEAGANGDHLTKRQYLMKAASTRTGISDDASAIDIYWTLPDNEKKFFNAFSQATGADRARILQMVPEDQIKLYKTIWDRMDTGGNFFNSNSAKLDEVYLRQQYQSTLESVEKLPREDWIGYNSQVNIRDIKVKYLHEQGKELRDFDIWESEVKRSLAAEPYLEGSTDFLYSSENSGRANHMAKLMANINTITNFGGSRNEIRINYNDNRQQEISDKYNRYVNAY